MVAEAALPGKGPILDLPDRLRRHPMSGAAARWASRPAAGPHERTNEWRVVTVQGPQQVQEATPNGIGEPGADVTDINQLACGCPKSRVWLLTWRFAAVGGTA
jgi:hypothetical protein